MVLLKPIRMAVVVVGRIGNPSYEAGYATLS